MGESVQTSVLSSSTRAAGSRTRVICGLARGDLPVHFQWFKDGVLLSSKTAAVTSNTFFTTLYRTKNLFDSSSASNRKDRKLGMRSTKRFQPSSVQITAIDEFSSLLTISSLEDQHTGNYTCVATNPAGHAQYTASLTVKGDF